MGKYNSTDYYKDWGHYEHRSRCTTTISSFSVRLHLQDLILYFADNLEYIRLRTELLPILQCIRTVQFIVALSGCFHG